MNALLLLTVVRKLVAQPVILLLLTGCTSRCYSALEKFAIEKWAILIDRIDDTQETQHVA
jgi:hypothetical protein